MGCPNPSQGEVPNEAGDVVDDGVETLSLCDLPFYGHGDQTVKCDQGPSSMSREEERDRESFEFSSGELGFSFTETIFCGRIIHSTEQGKGHPKKDVTTTMHKVKRRRFFRWKQRLFRKPRAGYHKMKTEEVGRQRRTDTWGMKGKKWHFLVFGSAKFPMEMGLRDIKTRQSRRTSPPTMFGLSGHAEAEIEGEKAHSSNSGGLLNILKSLICGRQSRPLGS